LLIVCGLKKQALASPQELTNALQGQFLGDQLLRANLDLLPARRRKAANYVIECAHVLIITKSKKAGRSWHHHSCALRRRSIGAGGMTGCGDYAQPSKPFPGCENIFVHS
jgi:hypothetical protein